MAESEVFRGMEGLKKVKSNWHALLDRHPNPRFFHHYEWWQAYLIALEPYPDSVHFVLFYDHNGPLAIVPLKHHTWRLLGLPLRELSFPNHPHMPLQDALYKPGVNVHALLIQWLRSSGSTGLGWDMVRLNGVMSESSLASDLETGLGKREAQGCAYFDCSRPYEEIFRRFSKSLQANLRRARNRWSREPESRFLVVTEPNEVAARFLEFLKVEASGWKGAAGSGTAIALHADLTRFYEELIARLSPEGRIRLYLLEVSGEVIAANLCIVSHDSLYGLKMGYDPRWSKLSPGSLLCEYLLKDAAATPSIRQLNCVTNMDWTRSWRPEVYGVYNLILFNSTPFGFLCRAGMHLKQGLAELRRKHAARDNADRLDHPDSNPSLTPGA